MHEIFCRAEQRREKAIRVIEKLDLLTRWSRFGRPVLVGAIRYGLMVTRDIDLEIYTDDPRIEHGFEAMSEVACLPGVRQVNFSNELEGPDQGLYWQIRFRDETGDVWNVDNWFVGNDHPHAHWGDKFADAMQKALTDETRRAILEIKEATLGEAGIRGIDVYRAVLEGGVRTVSEFRGWLKDNKSAGIILWLPST